MAPVWDDSAKQLFQVKEYEGESKVVFLEDAIRQYVRPGMVIHSGNYANALQRELLRQFWGKKPNFTLVVSVLQGFGFNLIHGEVVKKVITSNSSDLFLTPGPSPIVQKAFKEGTVEMENWSLYTHLQRLMAAAMNVPFLPTRSLTDTTIEEENKSDFQQLPNPFNPQEKIGVVKSLAPDISLIHGWVADPYGNTIPMFGDAESPWGAKASKNGAIVTVEKVVPTGYLREYPSLVKIPGHVVKAVAVAPFGAHPAAMGNPTLRGFEPYAHDPDFLSELRNVSKESNALNTWIEKWVLSCKTQEDYLAKLGYQRLFALRGRATKDSWEREMESLAPTISPSPEYSPVEMMVVSAARRLKEQIKGKGYCVLLTGVGTATLAGWGAYYWLREEGYLVDLLVGTGSYGYAPRPGSPIIFDVTNEGTSKMLTDSFDVYSFLVGGNNNSCIAVVGAGQIDKLGNINSTKLTKDLYLTGAGGGTDAAATANEVMVVAPQSARRFLDKVPYVTMAGERVKSLVSTLGIFQKVNDDQAFTLTHYFPTAKGGTREEKLKDIQANCGWQLKVARDIKEEKPPTWEELKLLRLLDPRKEFLG